MKSQSNTKLPRMEKLRRILKFLIGLPTTIIAFVFIIKIFSDNRDVVVDSIKTINPFLFFVGIIFFSLFFAIKSFVWIEILKKRGFAPLARNSIFGYSLSEVKRYIPGSIFSILGRVEAHSEAIPKKETLKGFGVEAVLLALSALVIPFPLWLFY